MLKWFNKQSTSSSSPKKQEESHQYSQLVNSALTENDYEFLFNQLLDGVSHGWHLGKIIKFFSNLESRSNIAQWIDWVERFEKKINYSPDPSQKKVGAIMMRFGELTKPNDDLQKLGLLFYRIGNQLFLGRNTDIIWEYAGQDISRQESQPAGINSLDSQEQFSESAVESNSELLSHANSLIADPDSNAEFGLEEEKSIEGSDLEQAITFQNDVEHPEIADHLDSSMPENSLVSQDLSATLVGDKGFEALDNSQSDQLLDASIKEENLASQHEVESTDQPYSEEFSPEEELINQAFEENLAAQNESEKVFEQVDEQPLEIDTSFDEEIFVEQADEENENLVAHQEVISTEDSFSGKFSPEEELINKAFEENLAAQSKRSESSQAAAESPKDQDAAHTGTKNREIVLDLSLDPSPEDLEIEGAYGDREIIDDSVVINDINQESLDFSDPNLEAVNGFAANDSALDLDDNLESQKLEVNSTDLERPDSQFSVGSFLEATEALSNNKSIEKNQVTVTWDEFVVALERDPVLARNVAQQLGMVGVNTPQDIVQAAVNRFNTQKQSTLSSANLELVKSWFKLGLKQASAKDFQGAISSWDQALKLNANLSEAWHNKGSALGRLGQYVEAIESFDHAVRLDPESYQAWNDRAHALYKMQEWSKAIASWDRAIQIMPDRHQFWYNRGCALEQIQSFDESVASYEKALEIKPDFQPARSRHTVLIANNF